MTADAPLASLGQFPQFHIGWLVAVLILAPIIWIVNKRVQGETKRIWFRGFALALLITPMPLWSPGNEMFTVWPAVILLSQVTKLDGLAYASLGIAAIGLVASWLAFIQWRPKQGITAAVGSGAAFLVVLKMGHFFLASALAIAILTIGTTICGYDHFKRKPSRQ